MTTSLEQAGFRIVKAQPEHAEALAWITATGFLEKGMVPVPPGRNDYNDAVRQFSQGFMEERRIRLRERMIGNLAGLALDSAPFYFTMLYRLNQDEEVPVNICYAEADEGHGGVEWVTNYTHRLFRRRGVGAAMGRHLIKRSGDVELTVGVMSDNTDGQRFYRNLGFEDTGQRRPFSGVRDMTEIVMRLNRERAVK